MEEAKEEQEMLNALLGIWSPEGGDKCDFKPEGDDTFFILGKVAGVDDKDP